MTTISVEKVSIAIREAVEAELLPRFGLLKAHEIREKAPGDLVTVADEARHIEFFTRRALLTRANPALSTAGGQASLKTLVDEPDFALASFLLSVLGEGSFLSLLWFLHEHGPDPITRQIAQLSVECAPVGTHESA